MAYLYMLLCRDGSLYTGITTDIARRIRQHTAGGPAGAKYTRAHPPVSLAGLWRISDLASAARLEYAVKQLTRPEKLALLAAPEKMGVPPYGPEGGIACTHLPAVTLEDCLSGWLPE